MVFGAGNTGRKARRSCQSRTRRVRCRVPDALYPSDARSGAAPLAPLATRLTRYAPS